MGKTEEIKEFASQGNTEVTGKMIKVAGMAADKKIERNSIATC